jgi:hypothetical protein
MSVDVKRLQSIYQHIEALKSNNCTLELEVYLNKIDHNVNEKHDELRNELSKLNDSIKLKSSKDKKLKISKDKSNVLEENQIQIYEAKLKEEDLHENQMIVLEEKRDKINKKDMA